MTRRNTLLKGAGVFVVLLVTNNLILSSPLGPSLFLNFSPPIIDDKYQLTTHIKSGGFGSVYSGYNIENNIPVAAKLETQDGHSMLKNEYQMLSKIQDLVGIPHVYCHKELSHVLHGRYQVLVMERLGPSIQTLITDPPATSVHIKVHNLLIFAVQALARLKDLHTQNILHNDIKPANYLLGTGPDKNNTVYMIDFGISTLYKKKDLHVIYSDGHGRQGTPGYQSFHTLLGEAPSRRDDLESLGYCLLALYPGYQLPWAALSRPQREGGSSTEAAKAKTERAEAILASMLETTVSDLCSDIPGDFVLQCCLEELI